MNPLPLHYVYFPQSPGGRVRALGYPRLRDLWVIFACAPGPRWGLSARCGGLSGLVAPLQGNRVNPIAPGYLYFPQAPGGRVRALGYPRLRSGGLNGLVAPLQRAFTRLPWPVNACGDKSQKR